MGDKSSVENEPQKRPTLFPGAHPGGGCDRVRVYEPLPPCFPITHHPSLCYFTYTTVSIRGLAAPKLRITREVWAGLPWVILWHSRGRLGGSDL